MNGVDMATETPKDYFKSYEDLEVSPQFGVFLACFHNIFLSTFFVRKIISVV